MAEEMIDVPEVEEQSSNHDENDEQVALSIDAAKDIGASSQELNLGIKHGMISKDEDANELELNEDVEEQEAPDAQVQADVDEKVESAEEQLNRIKADIKDGKELSETDEQLVHKSLSKEEKGFYFRAKKDRKQRQATQQHNALIQKTLEATEKENKLLKQRMEKYRAKDHFRKGIDDADDDDVITVADLKAREELLKEEEEFKQTSEEIHAASFNAQLAAIEAIAAAETAQNAEFPSIVSLVQELAGKDQTGRIIKNIDKRASQIGKDPEAQYDFIDYIYRVAKQHPKYKNIGNPPDKDKVDVARRVSKNVSKATSSASLPSGGGRKSVSENDLTPEEGARLPAKQWMKLKSETRHRLLGGF